MLLTAITQPDIALRDVLICAAGPSAHRPKPPLAYRSIPVFAQCCRSAENRGLSPVILLWAAVRYVERNPVRAGMERRAEDYRWSSAAAHCGKRADGLLNPDSDLSRKFSELENWSAWLAEGDEAEELQMLRRNVEKGLPCGSEGFVQKLGRQVGRLLEYRPQERPKKVNEDG